MLNRAFTSYLFWPKQEHHFLCTMYFFLVMVILVFLALQDASILAALIFVGHPELLYCVLYAGPSFLAFFIGQWSQNNYVRLVLWSIMSMMLMSPLISFYLSFACILVPLGLVWLACLCVHPVTTTLFSVCFILQFYHAYHSDAYAIKVKKGKNKGTKGKEEDPGTGKEEATIERPSEPDSKDNVEVIRDNRTFIKHLLCPMHWFPRTGTPLIRQGTGLRLVCIAILMLKMSTWTSSTLDWWDSVFRINPFGLL